MFPSSEAGQPSVDIMKPESNDLNEDIMLKWFYNIFKRASQIPYARWDYEQGGGGLFDDSSEITQDEIVFKDFIDRIRTIYKEIIVKPLRIQMILDFPELKDNFLFNTSIKVLFNKNGLFEEWKYLKNLEKRATIMSTLMSNVQDNNGVSWFSTEYLLKHIMKFSDEDIRENLAYKLKESGVSNEEQPGGFGGVQPGGAQPGGFGGAQPGGFGGAQPDGFGGTQPGGFGGTQPGEIPSGDTNATPPLMS